MTKETKYESTLIAKMDFPKQDDLTRHFGLILIKREIKYGTEYVTWIKYLDGSRENASGNYFDNLAAALRDFHNRCVRFIEFAEAKQARYIEFVNSDQTRSTKGK